MGSGNCLVDAQDRFEDEQEAQSKLLDCGCKKSHCRCDEGDDE